MEVVVPMSRLHLLVQSLKSLVLKNEEEVRPCPVSPPWRLMSLDTVT